MEGQRLHEPDVAGDAVMAEARPGRPGVQLPDLGAGQEGVRVLGVEEREVEGAGAGQLGVERHLGPEGVVGVGDVEGLGGAGGEEPALPGGEEQGEGRLPRGRDRGQRAGLQQQPI